LLEYCFIGDVGVFEWENILGSGKEIKNKGFIMSKWKDLIKMPQKILIFLIKFNIPW
jgi:hypothetical protein